jgi:hypothetical protein
MDVRAGHPVRELVQVRLADDDTALAADALHHRRVLSGRLVGKNGPAGGRDHPRHVDEVLHGDHRAFALFGRGGDEGVELGALRDLPARLAQVHRPILRSGEGPPRYPAR